MDRFGAGDSTKRAKGLRGLTLSRSRGLIAPERFP